MKYVANPVEVDAFRIPAVHEAADSKSLILTLEGTQQRYRVAGNDGADDA